MAKRHSTDLVNSQPQPSRITARCLDCLVIAIEVLDECLRADGLQGSLESLVAQALARATDYENQLYKFVKVDDANG